MVGLLGGGGGGGGGGVRGAGFVLYSPQLAQVSLEIVATFYVDCCVCLGILCKFRL